MKKICAITMARNDNFFLEKWISYYGAELGKENLFIFLDGKDQVLPRNAEGTNIELRDHVEEEMTVGDRTRIAFLSGIAANLLKKYDLVLGMDVDEFLVVDPRTGLTLREYLSQIKCNPSVSGLGVDVGQKLEIEERIDSEKPYLSQRSFALIDSQYTKPVVISKPVSWGAGFHRVKGKNYRIDKNLYLFHFGSFDLEILKQKLGDKSKLATGWSTHLEQRKRTINLIVEKKALNGETFLPIARFLQTIIRHPFLWTRPYMYFWKMVVRIPERFKNSV
jgi:hypothetical protein